MSTKKTASEEVIRPDESAVHPVVPGDQSDVVEEAHEVRERISRDEMLMRFAFIASRRGTCRKISVGVIIARHGRTISQGYVGSPPGFSHCLDEGCVLSYGHCIRTTHAEMNALLFAARHGIATEGAEMFITHHPCLTCAKGVITAGITRVVYSIRYGDYETVSEFLNQAGIIVEQQRYLPRGVVQASKEATEATEKPQLPAV